MRRSKIAAGLLLLLSNMVIFAATPNSERSVRLLTQSGYLPHLPVLVRVEVQTATGARDWSLWDAEAILSTDQPGITLSTNRVRLWNGLGSAAVTFSGGGDFTLFAAVESLQTSRPLVSLSGAPVTTFGGTLPGTSTAWSGVIRVTNDLTVPAGHTLTIQSNTLVLINGVASGTTAPDLLISGAVMSLGTELHPVTITCASNHLNWGQIRHNTAQPSVYRHTTITRGGRAPGEGHTGTGPMIRPANSRITFESCSFTDVSVGAARNTIGKIMYATGGASADLAFSDCLWARARMGPEITGSAVLVTNSYATEMLGPDDADGIYLLAQNNPSQHIKLVDSVFAYGEDDGIDTLNPVITIENCIVRDWKNPLEDAKGITIFSGDNRLSRCLVVDCSIALSAKANNGQTSLTRVDHCTIIGLDRALAAENKGGGQTNAVVRYFVTNCIIQATGAASDSVYTDYNPTNIQISYSNVGEPWPGDGNILADPLFVNVTAHDYRLGTNSPCIDAGDPASPADPDGTRTDLGVFPFLAPASPPALSMPLFLPDGSLQFTLHGTLNRAYLIQATSDFTSWVTLATVTNTVGPVQWTDPDPDLGRRFYRAEVVP